MGVVTLIPIYKQAVEICDLRRRTRITPARLKGFNMELSKLAEQALSDSSHEKWIQDGGKIETLIAKLELAFDVKVARQATTGS